MKIEIVSDVMCPWCVIGYKNLATALEQIPELDAEISWRAFELNPDMPEQGQNIRQHLMQKYGISEQQSDENRQRIEQMGAAAGFKFNFADDALMINSFNCHRLLAWSKQFNKQTELKMALFSAHFTENKRLNQNEVLLDLVEQLGLPVDEAKKLLDSDAYAEEVRAEQQRMQQLGINSVPTFIINSQYAINGGQPVEVFKQALNQIQTQSEPA